MEAMNNADLTLENGSLVKLRQQLMLDLEGHIPVSSVFVFI